MGPPRCYRDIYALVRNVYYSKISYECKMLFIVYNLVIFKIYILVSRRTLPCRVHCRRCGDIVPVHISLYGQCLSSVCIIYALHLYLNIVPDSIQYLVSIVLAPAGLFGLYLDII